VCIAISFSKHFHFLSVPNLLSCLSLLSCLFCLYFPEQHLHSFTLPLLPARHPAQRSSYFQPLSCPLLAVLSLVLSPVLSVTTWSILLRSSIQTHSSIL
jgi:hypothetical protein